VEEFLFVSGKKTIEGIRLLYDAHSHMDLMSDEELKEAITKSKEAKICEIVSCATSFASNENNLLLSKKYPQIKPALGLYPLDALELNETELDKAFSFFEEKIKNAFAIGEVGLDFKYSTNETGQEKQKNIFKRFIELSNKTKKPLIIHSRFAQKQVLEMLIENNAKKVLLHSFVDSQKLMRIAAEKEYFVSCGLAITQNPEIAKNISLFPIENLLFETDSPIRFNGEKTTPASIKLILEKVAEIKHLPVEEVEKQQEKNFKKLFY